MTQSNVFRLLLGTRFRFVVYLAGFFIVIFGLLSQASATMNHAATSVVCQVVSPDGNYADVLNPSPTNPATMYAINDTYPDGAKTQCTWTGFAPMGTLAVSGDSVTFQPQVTLDGSGCVHTPAQNGNVTTGYGGWTARSDSAPPAISYDITVNDDISKLTVVGTAFAGPNMNCTTELDIYQVYATY